MTNVITVLIIILKENLSLVPFSLLPFLELLLHVTVSELYFVLFPIESPNCVYTFFFFTNITLFLL